MLRHVIEGLSATAAAERHGYSRAAFIRLRRRSTRLERAGYPTSHADGVVLSSSRPS